MILHTYEQQIRSVLSGLVCPAPEGSVLGHAGRTVQRMVQAYIDDGSLFLNTRDPVNAVAAFGYAEGWLAAGTFLGLVSVPRRDGTPLSGYLPDPALHPRWVEKVHRYQRLLEEGIAALEPAPDQASILWRGCEEILKQAQTARIQGTIECSAGNLAVALQDFAYGHGWLDTGARTGLFRIVGRRELFTI